MKVYRSTLLGGGKGGGDMEYVMQPAQSPDLIINDLFYHLRVWGLEGAAP